MVCTDTFLITLYCLVDDFCKRVPASFAEQNVWGCGRKRSLSRSEVVTLSIYGQLWRFRSERDFWSFATQRLGHLFPRLPDRAEFVRGQLRFRPTLEGFSIHMAQLLTREGARYEVIDRCGVATRWCGRRGRDWLGGYADKGLCSRLGYFWGLHLLCSVSDEGVITGYGVAPGSAKDQPMATSLFMARKAGDSLLLSAGETTGDGFYVVDRGFSGKNRRRWWRERFGAQVVGPSQKNHGPAWPREWARWAAGLRQIVETVHDRLVNFFRLSKERPHCIEGFMARLAAKVALHNCFIWINRQMDRSALQFADLLAW
jgi:hypothetical protein